MKNLSLKIFLAIAALASPVWSQTIDDFVERDGKYYLKFTDESFSGKVEGKVQGTLKDGVWHGKYIEYWDNGQLLRKGNYKDGKQEGLWKFHYDNGRLSLKGHYEHGKSEGVWERFDSYSGHIIEITNFKNGKKDGLEMSFHDNGQLKKTGNYKNGKEEGLWEQYRDNGLLSSKADFKDGKVFNGLWEIYDEIDQERSKDRKSQIGSGDRSERIRTYNFPQGRVTDHRINLTLHKLEEFLSGEIHEEMNEGLRLKEQDLKLQNLA